LWRKGHLVGLAQESHHAAHLRECPRSRNLDDSKRLDGTLWVGCCDRPSCLGLGDDARDMVSDRVVEFARQLLTLAELGPSMSRMRAFA